MKWLLSGLAALLALILALQWSGWDQRANLDQADTSSRSSDTAAVAELPDVADLLTPPPPLEEYASVVEHTLFLPDRRPPAEDAEDESPSNVEEDPIDDAGLEGFDLTAVMLNGERRIAWVRLPKESKVLRLREGDELEGWTVIEIGADRLQLRQRDEQRQILLRDYKNAPPVIPPTRAGRPPADSRSAQGPARPDRQSGQKPDQAPNPQPNQQLGQTRSEDPPTKPPAQSSGE